MGKQAQIKVSSACVSALKLLRVVEHHAPNFNCNHEVAKEIVLKLYHYTIYLGCVGRDVSFACRIAFVIHENMLRPGIEALQEIGIEWKNQE